MDFGVGGAGGGGIALFFQNAIVLFSWRANMITSVLRVRANGQSIHARKMITSPLPVRVNVWGLGFGVFGLCTPRFLGFQLWVQGSGFAVSQPTHGAPINW